MGRLYLKLFGKINGYEGYLKYLSKHSVNTDLIQKDLVETLTDGNYHYNNKVKVLLNLLENRDVYNLNSASISKMFTYLYTNSQNLWGEQVQKIIDLVDDDHYIKNYFNLIKNIIKNSTRPGSNIQYLYHKILLLDEETAISVYPINSIVDDIKNMFSIERIKDTIIDNLFTFIKENNIEHRYKKDDYNKLLSVASKDKIINISYEEKMRLADTFEVLSKYKMNEDDYISYLKRDCVFFRPYSIEDVHRNSKVCNEIADNLIKRNNDEDDNINYKKASIIFRLLKDLSEEKKLELFNLILNSNDDNAIIELFNNELSEDYITNDLTKENVDDIIANIKSNKKYNLAYQILFRIHSTSNEILTTKQYDELFNIILKSNDYNLIAKFALFIDNSLIEPIFGSLDNLVVVTKEHNNGKLENDIKDKYENLKYSELDKKTVSNKKIKKRIKKYNEKKDRNPYGMIDFFE